MKFVTLIIASSATAAAVFSGDADAQNLTVTTQGGAFQKSQEIAYFTPYEKEFKAKIVQEEYNAEFARIVAMVQSGKTTWDVVDVNTQTAIQGCDEGTLLPIDYAKLGGREQFVKGSTYDCGVPTTSFATVLAFDADRLKDGPSTIAGLFDTKRWPGKRGLQKGPVGNLEFALIADGVATDKVYELLKTKAGVDRAFRKLDTIKKVVVWWEAGAQPPQLLASGEVAMSTAWNGRITSANKQDKRNFRIVWDAQLQDWDLWAIPKGVADIQNSYKFIRFASAPERQAEQTRYISYGPASIQAIKLVPADIAQDLPTAPQNIKNVIANDPRFWADHGEELRKRFNNWLAQ